MALLCCHVQGREAALVRGRDVPGLGDQVLHALLERMLKGGWQKGGILANSTCPPLEARCSGTQPSTST
eukprot:15226268-Heterocapsa_arctica.AAC.1